MASHEALAAEVEQLTAGAQGGEVVTVADPSTVHMLAEVGDGVYIALQTCGSGLIDLLHAKV